MFFLEFNLNFLHKIHQTLVHFLVCLSVSLVSFVLLTLKTQPNACFCITISTIIIISIIIIIIIFYQSETKKKL